MKQSEVINAIAIAMPKNAAGVAPAAEAYLSQALSKISHIPGVDFNRKRVEFTLTSGKSTYTFGKDLFSTSSTIQNLSEVWRTDVSGSKIAIVSANEFHARASGNSTPGEPRYATIHSSPAVMEVWPTPNSDFTCVGLAQMEVRKLEDVPERYHGLVVELGVLAVRAAYEPALALNLMKNDVRDLLADVPTAWQGNHVTIGRHMKSGRARGADSHNITGE